MFNIFKKKRRKYGNTKVETHGHSFASKLEASVYAILIKDPDVKSVQVQDHVPLTDARIIYIADFKCERQDGTFFWSEAKGFSTAVWAIKKRLWSFYGPGELRIYGGSHLRPTLSETITPKINKLY